MEIRLSEWQAAPRELKKGKSLIAVGDVHGNAAHLSALMDWVRRRADQTIDPIDFVKLGDFADRGPDTKGVYQLLVDGINHPSVTDVNLWSNHDSWFYLSICGSTYATQQWINGSGFETPRSYGIATRPDFDRQLIIELNEKMPQEHKDIFKTFKTHYRLEDYLCVHGGIHPDISLTKQLTYENTVMSMDDHTNPLWIRRSFLEHKEPFENNVVVIFGHTIGHPGFYTNKIALDSGCFSTGVLTAVEIIRDQMRFVYVHGSDPMNPDEMGELIEPGRGPLEHYDGY